MRSPFTSESLDALEVRCAIVGSIESEPLPKRPKRHEPCGSRVAGHRNEADSSRAWDAPGAGEAIFD
jgi:hypothetical protein